MTSDPGRWPSVTTVTPTLGNRPDLLEQTLQAIRDQDYPGKIESIVVLDSRSADMGAVDEADASRWESTRKVADAAGARLIENSRTPGLAGSRNTGIMAATGELVASCDDDDYWLPGKLRAQVAALAAEPSATLACCGIIIEYGDMRFERVHPRTVVTFSELLRSRLSALHVSSFLIRRAALLDGIGLVSEEIPRSRSEDYEFTLRIARHGPVLNVPQPLVHVRWHTSRPAMGGKWGVIAKALPWLLEQYPEFQAVPAGYARLAGRTAFALAASGDRRNALSWARKAIAANPREPRTYIAFGVMTGLVRPDSLVRWLHSRGRGI
jgi:glycosyltransferase involved in cell wall biosynthesis